MTSQSAYGTHAAVTAITAGAYPSLRLELGEPGTQVRMTPRWDLPATLVGYVAGSRLSSTSRSYSADTGQELFKIGKLELILPVVMSDAPGAVSPADGKGCQVPRRTRVAQSEAWLDMSDSSDLWHHWVSWSIGPTRIVFGAHRPKPHHRRFELLGTRSKGIPATLYGRRVHLFVDLNCDYTYVPHQIYVDHMVNRSSVRVDASTLRLCAVAAGHREPVCFHLHARDHVVRSNRYMGDAVIIGSTHARRLLVGHHVVSDELSLVPLDLTSSVFQEIDMLLWFGALLTLHCLWALAIYPGVAHAVRRVLLWPFSALSGTAERMDVFAERDISAFSVHGKEGNAAVVQTLHALTMLSVVTVAVVVVFGFNLPTTLNIDLPPAYTTTVVWAAVVAMLVSVAWPSFSAQASDVEMLVHHACNALRLAAWLVASLRYELWLMQVVMLLTSGLTVVRTGEMVLAAWFRRTGRGWAWAAYFAAQWLVVAWIFAGYTMPMLIDTWLSTLLFRVEFSISIGAIIVIWLPVYLYVVDAHNTANRRLMLYTAAKQ